MTGSKITPPANMALPPAAPGSLTRPMPGQMELLAQQIQQGYPSMPASATLPVLQAPSTNLAAAAQPSGVPATPATPAPATPAPAPTARIGLGGPPHGAPFESFSDFINYLNYNSTTRR